MEKPLNQEKPLLLSVRSVASLLGAGERTIWRLNDAGKMPRAVRVGGLVRWQRADIELWIRQGCPDCRRTGWTPQTTNTGAGERQAHHE